MKQHLTKTFEKSLNLFFFFAFIWKKQPTEFASTAHLALIYEKFTTLDVNEWLMKMYEREKRRWSKWRERRMRCFCYSTQGLNLISWKLIFYWERVAGPSHHVAPIHYSSFKECQVNCLPLFCPWIVGAGFQPAASNSLSVISLGKIYSADIECLELEVTAEALRPNCLRTYWVLLVKHRQTEHIICNPPHHWGVHSAL